MHHPTNLPEAASGSQGEASLIAASLRSMMRGWWIIGLCFAFFLGLALLYLQVASSKYTATMKIRPGGANELLSTLEGPTSPLSGFASLLKPMQSGDDFMGRYLNGITSIRVAEALAAKPGLLKQVFFKAVDPVTGDWLRPDDPNGGLVRNLLNLPPWSPPGAEELNLFIQKQVKIEAVGTSDIRAVSVELSSKEAAENFLRTLHEEVESQIWGAEMARRTGYIEHLTERLRDVQSIEHRVALSQLIVANERVLMILNTGGDVAVDVFDPIYVYEDPTSPKPGTAILASIILGLFFGTVISLWRDGRRRRKRSAQAQR